MVQHKIFIFVALLQSKGCDRGFSLNSRFPRSRAWLVWEFYFSGNVSVYSLGVSIILGNEWNTTKSSVKFCISLLIQWNTIQINFA